ncbi:MAG: phenylalanine--tRNA ligase subunit alpha [Chitinophagales bacterium]|nr:phenylalanine--tRNA ligase subunit alpha [Chitinophagales bacterium]
MEVLKSIEDIQAEINNTPITDSTSLEQFRIKYLGSKNVLKDLFAEIINVPSSERREFGQLINTLKLKAEARFEKEKKDLEFSSEKVNEEIDVTRPANFIRIGSLHPVSIVKNKVIDIFSRLGFTVAEGPEIEDEWHNFTALNTPENHPARDMTDSFYIEYPNVILRSQTSNVQVRVMETHKPPIRIIAPGRVYRNETITYKHHIIFHQLEGLYIDKDVSFADLKQTLHYFFYEFFGAEYEYRLRPSYFPFTEPSAEMDIRKKGNTEWMELLGCGMVHPKVLENCGIDPAIYSGYAWGMGIERLPLLKYGITDIRLLFENDVRFLEQFEGVW